MEQEAIKEMVAGSKESWQDRSCQNYMFGQQPDKTQYNFKSCCDVTETEQKYWVLAGCIESDYILILASSNMNYRKRATVKQMAILSLDIYPAKAG